MRTLRTLPSYNIVCVHNCNVCKQSLIRGGGQLLGNDDGVRISLGSALPVGNSYKSFQGIVHDI